MIAKKTTTEELVETLTEENNLTQAQKDALQSNVSKGSSVGFVLKPPAKQTDEDKKEAAKSLKVLMSEQDKLKTALQKNEELFTVNATGCINHIRMYGDTSILQRLFTCLPRTFNVDGFRMFIERTTPIAVPRLEWNKEKQGWYTITNKDGKNTPIRLFDKKSPRVERLKKANAGEIWNTEAIKTELQEANGFRRLPQERKLEPFTALVLFTNIRNVRNKLDNAYADESPRMRDESYGDFDQMSEWLTEIETLVSKFEAEAIKLHDAATGETEGTRLVKRGTAEHQSLTAKPQGASSKVAAA